MPRPTSGYLNKAGEKVPGTNDITGRYGDKSALLHWAHKQGKAGLSLYDRSALDIGSAVHKMAELDPASAEYAQVADRFHQLDSEFRTRDGYAIEAQVGTVLAGLGFPHSDWERRTEHF